jgi:HSP20 family protein
MSAKKTDKSKTTDKTAAAVEVAKPSEAGEPFGMIGDWFDQWPRMFDRHFPDLLGRGFMGGEGIRVEQFTDGDDIVIRAEVPGVDPEEDIEVSVASGKLTIAAERQQKEESRDDKGFRSEFHYGSFRRIMTLPPGTTADDVSAGYEDGILEVRVPVDKDVESKTRVAVERKG